VEIGVEKGERIMRFTKNRDFEDSEECERILSSKSPFFAKSVILSTLRNTPKGNRL